MSVHGIPASTGLPAVNQAREPEWVRRGSAATQKAYDSALAFEQTLVEQLSSSLAATSGLGGESSPEGESGSPEGDSSQAGAGAGELSSVLPQALTSSVMRTGGLGLAAQMTSALGGVDATARTSGGTAPRATAGARVEATAHAPARARANTEVGLTGGTAA
jgi:hypothetical protein